MSVIGGISRGPPSATRRKLAGTRMHERSARRAVKVFFPDLVEADLLQDPGARVVADSDDGPQWDTDGVQLVPAHQGFGDLCRKTETPTASPNDITQPPTLGSSTEACPTHQRVIEVRQAPLGPRTICVLDDVLIDQVFDLRTRFRTAMADERHRLWIGVHLVQCLNVVGQP